MSIPVQGTSVTGRDRALVQRSRSMCTWCESPPRTQDLNRTGFRGGSQSGRLGVMGAPRRYPDELRERAVRMVFETRRETAHRQRWKLPNASAVTTGCRRAVLAD